MKREIKFRVWNGEEMVSPDYIDRDGSAHWHENSIPQSSKELMQFTGLKDKNGREIYEGDIIKLIQYTYYFTHTAIFEVTIPKIYLIDDIKHKNSEVKVIGNIYENPELLEETKWTTYKKNKWGRINDMWTLQKTIRN